MISFSQLGKFDRLGNQLFQYAFLRTQAQKLGTSFYCPHWIGDEVFNLDDKELRAERPSGIVRLYQEQFGNKEPILLDNSEIKGHFESEEYFDKTKAREWYSFKEEKIVRVKEKYKSVDFSNSAGIHLRLGDHLFKKRGPVLKINYYLKAIKKIGTCENLLVFSDSMDIAKEYFKNIPLKFIFIEDNNEWEDLYLMTRCRDFVCGVSTFSWWGAWLNNNQNKKITFPRPVFSRSYGGMKDKNFVPKEWTKIRALTPITDNRSVRFLMIFFNDLLGKIGIFIKKISPTLYKILKIIFSGLEARLIAAGKFRK